MAASGKICRMLADGMIPRPRLARKAHLVSKNKDLTQSRKDAENGKKEFFNLGVFAALREMHRDRPPRSSRIDRRMPLPNGRGSEIDWERSAP
jgi:hypothetical protein